MKLYNVYADGRTRLVEKDSRALVVGVRPAASVEAESAYLACKQHFAPTGKYAVVQGSCSGHCCFSYSVVIIDKPDHEGPDGYYSPDSVAEVLSIESDEEALQRATLIANLFNELDKDKKVIPCTTQTSTN